MCTHIIITPRATERAPRPFACDASGQFANSPASELCRQSFQAGATYAPAGGEGDGFGRGR